MAHRYTDEQKNFIKKHVKGRRNKELTEMFNKVFNTDLKPVHIRDFKSRHGLKSGLTGPVRQYTDEHIEFLKEHVKGRSLKELTDMFNARFGLNKKQSQISNAKTRYGLKSGIKGGQFEKGQVPWNKGMKGLDIGGKETRFKKGQAPQNYRPVGSERVNSYGYTDIKIADPDIWKSKHNYLWEKENGSIPEGYAVIFGDGNKRNFDIDNLILVSRAQLLKLNQYDLIQNDAALTKVGVTLVDINMKLNERKKEIQNK